MATVAHQPWKPTCWVGGMANHRHWPDIQWLGDHQIQICDLPDDSRTKYAATKATSAILRSIRK